MSERSAHNGFKAEKISLVYCLFGLLWILLSDTLMGMLISDPQLLVSLGTFKGVLFIATTTTLLYLTLKLWQQPSVTAATEEGRSEILLVFGGLALLVPLLATAVGQVYLPVAIKEARSDVAMIAANRASRVDSWLDERHRELYRLQESPDLQEWLSHPSASELITHHAEHQLDVMVEYAGFERAILFDGERQPLLSAGALVEFPSDAAEWQMLRDGIRFSAPYQHEGRLMIDWLVQLDTGNHATDGYLLLSCNLTEQLYPLISDWPLARYLVELRLADEHPAGLRRGFRLLTPGPDSSERLFQSVELSLPGGEPLSRAQLSDEVALLEVQDAEGQVYLLAMAGLTEVPWYLLARIDRSAALAPVYTLLAWVVLLALAAVAAICVALGLVWQKTRRVQQLALARQAAEKDQLLLKFFELPFVGMSITDPASGRWTRFNEKFCAILGYTPEELAQRRWFDLTHPDDLDVSEAQYRRLMSGEQDSYTIEKRFIRADGSSVPVLLNLRAIRDAAGSVRHAIATIQDISDQKRYEAQLIHQRDLYNTLSETNQMIVRCQDSGELLQQVCRIAVEQGGMSFAWFGWVQKGAVGEQTRAGAADLPGDDREWSLLSQRQAMSEAIQRVLQQQSPVVTDNPFDDIGVSSRVQYAHQLRSMACFPVCSRDDLVGVFCVCARESDFFTPDIVGTLGEMADDVGYALAHLAQAQALETAAHVVRASPVVLFRWQLEESWPVLYVSDNIRRWGYEPDQFLSGEICYGDLMDPAERVMILEQGIQFRQEGKENYTFEYRIRKADGEWIWVEDTSHLIRRDLDDSGLVEGVVTEITARKQHQQRLDHIAHYDALTGLPNRLSMLEAIAAQQASLHSGGQLVCMVLDLDRFNDINDSFGHTVGDGLLCKVAGRLRGLLEVSDQLARLSGDEFVILLGQQIRRDQDGVAMIAQLVLRALEQPYQLEGGIEIRIGASIGISLSDNVEEDPEELLRQADTALYFAKESGRNQFRFYRAELTAATRDRLSIETRLRMALEQGQLQVFYQPQVEISAGRVVGAEALIRWFDPEQGPVSPALFIPVAEQSGMINQIGAWVLEQVCSQGQRWLEQGYDPLRLAVNLSAYQMRHTDVVAQVEATLQRTGFPPDRLELELTESALMSHEAEAERVLGRLRALGISLAIDDFGTGYSSLAYLKRFAVDFLKIDKSFVDDITQEGDDREIAATIVAMSHTLGLRTVAEGVETESQLELLKELGCDVYQGYLKSPAVDAAAFEATFLTRTS